MNFRIQRIPSHRAMMKDRIDITAFTRAHARPRARALLLRMHAIANTMATEEEKEAVLDVAFGVVKAELRRRERLQALLQSLPLDTQHTA